MKKTKLSMNFKFLLPLLGFLNLSVYSQVTFTNQQYGEALQKSLFFYEAQQSGVLPSYNRVSWRAASGLNDGKDVSKDLTGGWYDAGDHVKFGFPMAYTATMLGWSVLDYKAGYEKSGQYTIIKNNLRFVYDYFIKCHTAPNEFYGQVGNGGEDHRFWGAPEIMQMKRPSYKIDATKPGTDLSMETASALAIGSMIFAQEDPTYSANLLKHAKELYDFGDKYRGKYSDAITDASEFYKSWSGFNDELVWGGLWMYNATKEKKYLDNAEAAYDLISTDEGSTIKPYKFGMAWDDKIYGCYPLLAKFTGKPKYYEDMERNLDFWTDGHKGQKVTYTPGGLAWISQWGSLRYSLNTAFMAMIYTDLPNANAAKKTKYKNFATSQLNYALGNNPDKRSYMCGFGNNPPKNPHHRGAHGTWNDNLTGPPETNRHILYGALVGGPNNSDVYKDDRGDYISNEVATDYNAGITGVLAKVLSEGTNVSLPPIPKEVVGEEYVATIKSNSSGADYFEPAINILNHTAWPARMPKKLSFRYFIDISEGIAKGFKASDYALKLNYAPDATLIPGLKQWTGNIYYAEIEYNNALFYPGGQSPSKRECQIRVTGPNGAWNATNDFSNTGVTSEFKNTLYIPIYENGVKIYGNEPARPLSNTDYDLAIQNSIKVLPNPTSGIIKIDLPESVDIKNININDLAGRLLTSQNVLSAKIISMDISNLPVGLYIMTFKSEDKVWTKKIIKE
jgi:endoglucanase